MRSFSSDRRLFLFSRERTAIFWCSSNVSNFCGVIRWYNRDIRLQSLGVSTSANVIIVCFIRGRSEVLPSRFVFYVLFRQSSPWLNIEREVFHTYIFSIILLDFDFNNEGEDIFAAINFQYTQYNWDINISGRDLLIQNSNIWTFEFLIRSSPREGLAEET